MVLEEWRNVGEITNARNICGSSEKKKRSINKVGRYESEIYGTREEATRERKEKNPSSNPL